MLYLLLTPTDENCILNVLLNDHVVLVSNYLKLSGLVMGGYLKEHKRVVPKKTCSGIFALVNVNKNW